MRVESVSRRAWCVMAVVLVTSACSGSSHGTGSTSAGSDSAHRALVHFGLPADTFTRTASAHDVSAVVSKTGAVAKVIGAKGGTLTTTGPDRTRYTLTIPAKDLPMATPISMVPFARIGGLPAAAAHREGVELLPEGLPLTIPATLTITPATRLPNVGIATLTFSGEGKRAGLVLHRRVGATEQVPIPHFSGWTAVYPVDDAAVRTMFNEWVNDAADNFQAAVTALLGVRRQEQLTNNGSSPTLTDDELDALTKAYTDDVLEPRERLAANGCVEAEAALQAYVSYERVMQLLGIASDPTRYARWGRPVPDSLIQTHWNVCLREQFARCTKTGDFPAFEYFLLSVIRQAQLFGANIPDQWLADGTSRLEQCGRWEAKIDTYYDGSGQIGYERFEAVRNIPLHWKPGAGPFGIFGATIDGEGPVEVTLKQTNVPGTAYGPATPQIPATAEIKSLTFDEPPWYLPGSRPIPRDLQLDMNFGTARYANISTITGYYDYSFCCESWEAVLNILTNDNVPDWAFVDDPRNPMFGTTAWIVQKGWQYDDSPYRAFTDQTGTKGTSHARLEITLKHAPA